MTKQSPEFIVTVSGPHIAGKDLLADYLTAHLLHLYGGNTAPDAAEQEKLRKALGGMIVSGATIKLQAVTVQSSPVVDFEQLVNQTKIRRMKLKELGFAQRTLNCFIGENITTVEDLLARTEYELLRVPNLGRRSLNDVKDCLARFGLALKSKT